jgi:hypothetical protein
MARRGMAGVWGEPTEESEERFAESAAAMISQLMTGKSYVSSCLWIGPTFHPSRDVVGASDWPRFFAEILSHLDSNRQKTITHPTGLITDSLKIRLNPGQL